MGRSPCVNAKALKSMPVFAGLDRSDLARIAACAEEVEVPAGEPLLEQGQFAFEFFAIRSGAAHVSADGVHIADLGPGDVVGELGALTHGQRNATVVTTAPTSVVFIRAQDFRHFAAEMPEFAARIRQVVRDRIHA